MEVGPKQSPDKAMGEPTLSDEKPIDVPTTLYGNQLVVLALAEFRQEHAAFYEDVTDIIHEVESDVTGPESVLAGERIGDIERAGREHPRVTYNGD